MELVLSGLSCAFELKNKGYIVDLYEKENILGQEVYEIYKEILSEEFINEDLKKLKDLGVNICLNSVFDKSQLDKYKENYDVIIIDGNIYDENLDYDEIIDNMQVIFLYA